MYTWCEIIKYSVSVNKTCIIVNVMLGDRSLLLPILTKTFVFIVKINERMDGRQIISYFRRKKSKRRPVEMSRSYCNGKPRILILGSALGNKFLLFICDSIFLICNWFLCLKITKNWWQKDSDLLSGHFSS